MNVRQQKFCDYYLQSGNATDAAIKAGYSEKTAYSIGQRLLKNVEIEKYNAEHQQKAHKERIATAEEILEFWSETMRDEELTRKDRLRASENLGKRYRLLEPEKGLEEQNPVNIEITFEDCRNEDKSP